MQKVKELLAGNTLVAEFICQGKVAPDLIQWMQRLAKENPDHPHGMSEERKSRLAVICCCLLFIFRKASARGVMMSPRP